MKQYLLDRDPNERDIEEMKRWVALHEAEVTRIVNVLNYWITVPLRCERASLR